MRFTDKVGIITGAANGIGKATAFKLAAEGAKGLVLADIDAAHGAVVASQITEQFETNAIFVEADCSQAEDNKTLVDTAVGKFGRLDFAFNNAGIEGAQAPLADYPVDMFDKLISINLRGVFLAMKFQIPAMLESGGGAILNMSSVAGLKGFATLSPYVASKHAVIGLSKSAALEYAAQNIRVNVVNPGAIDTEMIHRITHGNEAAEQAFQNLQPVGRYGTPNEIADFVAWICSDEARFVTGVTVPIDGGIMAG